MARRPREGANISWVPILSIQKCTMGVLVVIICAQSLISIGRTANDKNQYLEIAGGAGDKEPVYVECHAKGVLLHPERTDVSLDALRGAGPSPFHQLLDRLGGGKQYLVLLIRPEGVPAFQRCYDMARMRGLPVGKDAILSGGDIILTKDGRPLVTPK
jgi:hypothetical protein